MATGDFEKCMPYILRFEGGWSDNSHDPGGATQQGITLAVYRQSYPGATVSDLRGMPNDRRDAIYRKLYWQAAACDGLPAGLDLCTFDAAVNSGVGAAHRWLARCMTGSAIERIHAFSAARLSMLHGLRTWRYFGKGWAARVAGIEAASVRMALGTDARAPAIMIAKSDAAKVNAKLHLQKAGGSGVGAGGAAVASHPMHGSLAITGAVVALAAITAAAFWIKEQQQEARAEAFAKAAMEPA